MLIWKIVVILLLCGIFRLITFAKYNYSWRTINSDDFRFDSVFANDIKGCNNSVITTHNIGINIIFVWNGLPQLKSDVQLMNTVVEEMKSTLSQWSELFSFKIRTAVKLFSDLQMEPGDRYDKGWSATVMRQLTAHSTSLWNEILDSSCSLANDCAEMRFVVHMNGNLEEAKILNKMKHGECTTAEGFVSRATKGSFVLAGGLAHNSSSAHSLLARVVCAQRSHLEQLLGVSACKSQEGTDDSQSAHRNLLAAQTSALYSETLRVLDTVHALRVRSNSLLWTDVLIDSPWVRQYGEVISGLHRTHSLSRYMHCGLHSGLDSGLDCGLHSAEQTHAQTLQDDGSLSIAPTVSVDTLHADLWRLRALALLLRDDPHGTLPLLQHWPLASLQPYLEQSFALFAPFWLPLLVPFIKVARHTYRKY